MVSGETSVRKMKNRHNKLAGSKIERSDDRIDTTAEVFTPLEVCIKMVNEISEDILKDPESTFLDPSAGNGNFIISLRDKLIKYGEDPNQFLSMENALKKGVKYDNLNDNANYDSKGGFFYGTYQDSDPHEG